jgi:hypothetical protein
MSIYRELRGFVLAHRTCGDLKAAVGPQTDAGYRVVVKCRGCGADFKRWVTPARTEEDLLRSALLAFEN